MHRHTTNIIIVICFRIISPTVCTLRIYFTNKLLELVVVILCDEVHVVLVLDVRWGGCAIVDVLWDQDYLVLWLVIIWYDNGVDVEFLW